MSFTWICVIVLARIDFIDKLEIEYQTIESEEGLTSTGTGSSYTVGCDCLRERASVTRMRPNMSNPVSASVSLIAAVCRDNGLGVEGRLPWRLKREMAYFTRVTSSAAEGKRNAVIMGRKTWQSIPLKFRPLPNRVNAVLSQSLKEVPEGAHHLFPSLRQSIEELSKDESIDKLFVIGGQKVYENTISEDLCQYIYLTRIDAHFDCDVFFPDIDGKRFEDITKQSADIPQEEQQENDLSYRYFLYKRLS